jgi:peptidoglycan/LPS O-acetylase OafA/YrhL
MSLLRWRFRQVQFLDQRSAASYAIDLIRAVAAISVMLFHVRSQLYVGIGQAHRATLLTKIAYFATSIGSEWVMVFFVLSGFLIAQSVVRSIRDDRWSWRAYLINRVVRLWMVLLPALLLTAFWDRLGVSLFTAAGYGEPVLNWQVFLGNLFFLNGPAAPQYGTNVPLWSLPYEFWYYMLFPCIVLAATASRVGQKARYGILALLIALVAGPQIMLYFLVWLLGCLVMVLPPLQFRGARPLGATAAGLAFGAFVAATTASKLGLFHSEFPARFLVGATFALLLYVLVSLLRVVPTRADAAWTRAAGLLAGFSYTLYLTHFPVRNFLLALRDHLGMAPWQPNAGTFLLGLLVATGIMGYAWLVALVTEARTDAVRRMLMRATASRAGATSGRQA